MKTNINLWSYLAHFFLEWEMFQTKFVEEIKTHILCSVTFFFKNHAVYEIRWTNIAEPEGLQMTIWRMRIACWIAKATNTNTHTHTHREYVILIAFRRQQWLQEPASALPYTYIAFIVCFVTDMWKWVYLSKWWFAITCYWIYLLKRRICYLVFFVF